MDWVQICWLVIGVLALVAVVYGVFRFVDFAQRAFVVPREGSREHSRIIVRQERELLEERVKNYQALAAEDRKLFMLLDMGPGIIEEIGKAPNIKIMDFGAGRNLDSSFFAQLLAQPAETMAIFGEKLKATGLWAALDEVAKKKGIHLEEVFAPRAVSAAEPVALAAPAPGKTAPVLTQQPTPLSAPIGRALGKEK